MNCNYFKQQKTSCRFLFRSLAHYIWQHQRALITTDTTMPTKHIPSRKITLGKQNTFKLLNDWKRIKVYTRFVDPTSSDRIKCRFILVDLAVCLSNLSLSVPLFVSCESKILSYSLVAYSLKRNVVKVWALWGVGEWCLYLYGWSGMWCVYNEVRMLKLKDVKLSFVVILILDLYICEVNVLWIWIHSEIIDLQGLC